MKKKILILSLVFLVIDQISKILVLNNFEQLNSIKIVNNLLYITFVKNEGAAFSILQGGRIIFIVLSLIVLFVMIMHIIKDKKIRKVEFVCYSLLLAGIVGNLIDRVIYGYVVDFIDMYFFGYDFPIFNVADICIVFGAIIFASTYMTKGEKDEINNC
ncbi:MAG: signal peptidase II [Bacilli bacterium]|nr:signal peptidase II [Bacilli bacterium]